MPGAIGSILQPHVFRSVNMSVFVELEYRMPDLYRDFLGSTCDLNGRSILITGGTGSFGKEFVKIILQRCKPERIVIFSRDELKQYEMAQEYSDHMYPCMRYFIGDVRDQQRLEMAMQGIDFVIHAAAMKHVAIAEYNPFECVQTNIIGAENVVRAALKAKVKRIVALSTDKAASPVNLYGATKLASDKIFVAANNIRGNSDLRISVVRYGNVIGSRGSVVPLFRKILANGATSIPITHPDMSRFWITLEQGVNLVLSTLSDMKGGEIFVPKIPSMRVVDLARVLAPHLPQDIIGVRPGEKLHEVMITADDSRQTLEFHDRFAILPQVRFFDINPAEYAGARPVVDGFTYSSDINTEWLDAEGCQALLVRAGA